VSAPRASSANAPPAPASKKKLSLAALSLAVAALVVGVLVHRTREGAAGPPAAAPPKPVRVVHATAKPFQPTRMFVGTLQPWLAADVGPQLVSAYVDSVEVRPGAVVKRGELLATLDCRDASAASQAVAMEARAIDARQKALAAESARLQDLLAKHFVSPNEAQLKAAASAEEAAKLEAHNAKLARRTLEVQDCVLRAPFDGEVATRTMDPGGFARPGTTIVSVVDRNTVRYSADAPEIDFDRIAPGTPIRIQVLAARLELVGTISRRAPAADPSTRTVHFEVDVADPQRRIPVGTTGEARIDAGPPLAAAAIPSAAAALRGSKATVFVVENGIARTHTYEVKGELGGTLFVDPALAAGSAIVTEGRALLADGDRVVATDADPPEPPAAPVKASAQEEHR
jgi:RND family efflux transporter MFP subunit